MENNEMTQTTECKSCKALIFFHKTKAGKMMPINCKPTIAYVEGQGLVKVYLTHFATCPDAQRFSKGK